MYCGLKHYVDLARDKSKHTFVERFSNLGISACFPISTGVGG